MNLIRIYKTFDHGNNLKWNHEALALQIKVISSKQRRPLTYSVCLKLRVCSSVARGGGAGGARAPPIG